MRSSILNPQYEDEQCWVLMEFSPSLPDKATLQACTQGQQKKKKKQLKNSRAIWFHNIQEKADSLQHTLYSSHQNNLNR